MGSKTIDITDVVYERLSARKRREESFSELIDRLLDDTTPDWREGFGMLDTEDTELLKAVTSRSRVELGRDLSLRQADSLDRPSDIELDEDEAP